MYQLQSNNVVKFRQQHSSVLFPLTKITIFLIIDQMESGI